MAKRKNISKTMRFEVFKRDGFTCQYCGRHAPDVLLEIDHIKPVADGGDNSILNLITSCRDCNRGKGKRKLTESVEVGKQFNQLKELEERRQQAEMMLEWREELMRYQERQIDILCREFCGDDSGICVNSSGRLKLKLYIKKYGFDEVLYAVQIARSKYGLDDPAFAFDKIGGICYNRAHGIKWKGRNNEC